MKPVHLGDVGANRVERQPNHPRNRLLAVECSSLLLGDLHQPIDLVEAADYQAFFATNARMRQEHRATYERGVAEGRLPTKERGLMVRGMPGSGGRTRPAPYGPAWLLNAAVNH